MTETLGKAVHKQATVFDVPLESLDYKQLLAVATVFSKEREALQDASELALLMIRGSGATEARRKTREYEQFFKDLCLSFGLSPWVASMKDVASAAREASKYMEAAQIAAQPSDGTDRSVADYPPLKDAVESALAALRDTPPVGDRYDRPTAKAQQTAYLKLMRAFRSSGLLGPG